MKLWCCGCRKSADSDIHRGPVKDEAEICTVATSNGISGVPLIAALQNEVCRMSSCHPMSKMSLARVTEEKRDVLNSTRFRYTG